MDIEGQRRHRSLVRMGQVLAITIPLSCIALSVTSNDSTPEISPSSPQITDGVKECASFDGESTTIYSAALDLKNRNVQGSITIQGSTYKRYENWSQFHEDGDISGIMAQGIVCGLRQPDWIDGLKKWLQSNKENEDGIER